MNPFLTNHREELPHSTFLWKNSLHPLNSQIAGVFVYFFFLLAHMKGPHLRNRLKTRCERPLQHVMIHGLLPFTHNDNA